jgi:heme exporter protein D
MKSVVNYFHLAGEFTNPAKFIWGAFLSGLIVFIIAIVLVVLLRKYILVTRSSKILRFIAYA